MTAPSRTARLLPVLVLAGVVTVASMLVDAHAARAASPTRVPRAAATLDRIELTQVRLINQHRRARGLPVLRVDASLTRAAGWMALDLGRSARFAHTDSLGRDPFDRLRAFGYPSRDTWRGENLAAGNPRPGPTFRQWRTSPLHYRNMIHPRYHAIGIARVRVAGSPFRWYWATTFGSRWIAPPAAA
jgi:uncharacterized protein YkwD